MRKKGGISRVSRRKAREQSRKRRSAKYIGTSLFASVASSVLTNLIEPNRSYQIDMLLTKSRERRKEKAWKSWRPDTKY